MSDERRKILEMVAAGKISPGEGERLLEALAAGSAGGSAPPEEEARPRPRWLHIEVDPADEQDDGERVKLKIPLMLLRTGLKIGSLLPGSVQGRVFTALGKKGIDLNLSELGPEAADELIDSLSEATIEVEGGEERVRIYCR